MDGKNNQDFTIRFAAADDTALILDFIKQLAVYEKLEHEVSATEEQLRRALFTDRYAEMIIGEEAGRPVAFALFFHNFSTFLAKPGIYLEDLFVRADCRGRGYGKRMLQKVTQIALERGCGRVEWSCLDWNDSSIQFYLGLGAVPMNEWTVYRLHGAAMEALGGEK